MEQTILSEEQRRAIRLFAQQREIAPLFYLTGGTALSAFYLGHRYSDDLDFFTAQHDFPQFAVEALTKRIAEEIGAAATEYRRLHDRRIFFFKTKETELKVEFTLYPFLQIEAPQSIDGLLVDSLSDISANKLMAMFDRIEAKDFVDLYFLMKETRLTVKELQKFVRQKFGFVLDPVALGSEFAKVRHLTILPRMVKPLTLDELKSFFADAAKGLSADIFRT